MALATFSRPAPFGAITTLSLVNTVEFALKTVSDWNTRRKTHNILSNLSDRELADIGLSRSDLDTLPARF